MTIDHHLFTPAMSLLGGLLIGLSAAIYLMGLGRIAGIAGIVGNTLHALGRGRLQGQAGPLAFIGGLLLAPSLWALFHPLPTSTAVTGEAGLLLAGLLVGVGVRMGNGCTSGHGVCGLSRLSLRSLANVMAFMGGGAAVVFVIRHLIGG
jgi:uncharacterized protein